MKILVTGVKGQLGFDVVKELYYRGYNNLVGIDIDDLDITDEQAVNNYFKSYHPNVIIHCAAYTLVDKAEDNPDQCYRVNVYGTKYLVEQAIKNDAKFVYISTDYIFDGNKKTPYEINDEPNPKSIYGKSKLLGEFESLKNDKHFIIRVSWVFGKNGNNFIKTILRLSKEKNELDIVSDQIGSPTYTVDLAKLIIEMIETDKYGIYHATNEGFCSWFEFANEICKVSNIDAKINSITSDQYFSKAQRPLNSTLSKYSLVKNGFMTLPDWQDALIRYLKEIEVI